MQRILFLIPLALSLIACGPSHEGTLTYQVRLDAKSVTGGTIADDTHVDPEDAQWTVLLSQARDALGEAPTQFKVTDARIQLYVPGSKNVGMLQDVLSGDVTVFLRASDSGAQVDIADIKDPKGSAQLDMRTTGNSLKPLEASLGRSDFRLGLRGSTSKTSTSDFEAVILLTLDVTAR